MKHERNIKPEPKKNWRLSKTLSRQVSVRVMEPDDLKYAWAAYRKGGLTQMGAPFDAEGMTADQFREAFEAAAERYNEGWIVSAETPRGVFPVGMVFGSLAPVAAYVIVAGIAWFPWASRRNIVEGTVAFFNTVRRQFPMIGYADDTSKRLYEVCCMHGVMRRIGTSLIVLPGRSAAVFETRA